MKNGEEGKKTTKTETTFTKNIYFTTTDNRSGSHSNTLTSTSTLNVVIEQ